MACVYQRGSAWWIRFRRNGREVRRSAGTDSTREQAERFLQRHLENAYTVAEFAPEYLAWSHENKRSFARDTVLVGHLVSYIGDIPMRAVTTSTVDDYRATRMRHVSPASVNREVSCLRKMLNMAVERGAISENPIAGQIQPLREPDARVRYLNQSEVQRLIFECADHLKPIVRLALLTGMRKTEIVGLRWTEVDLARGVVNLPSERTKNKRSRTVPLDVEARKVLKAQVKIRPEGCPLVFWRKPLRRRGRVTVGEWEGLGNIRKAFESACRRARINDFRFNDLRCQHATEKRTAGEWIEDTATSQGTVRLRAVADRSAGR